MKGMKYPGHRGGVLFLLVALAVIGVLVLSQGATVWATPNQDALHETIPTPVAGGQVVTVSRAAGIKVEVNTPALQLTLEVPSLALPINYKGNPIVKAINLDMRPKLIAEVPKPALGKTLVRTFSINAYEGLDARPGIIFDKLVILTFKVTAAELAAANGDITRVICQTFEVDQNQWTNLPTTPDIVAGTVKCSFQHLSDFALAVPEVVPAPTATLVPGVLPTPTPTAIALPGDFAPSSGLLIGLLLLGFSLVFAGVYYFRRAWAQGK